MRALCPIVADAVRFCFAWNNTVQCSAHHHHPRADVSALATHARTRHIEARYADTRAHAQSVYN